MRRPAPTADLHFWLGAEEPTGARIPEKGDVRAEVEEYEPGKWRFVRMEFLDRERFRASGAVFTEWTERARLPLDWKDEGYPHPTTMAVGEILPGGVAIGDFDGDGWPDLFIARSGKSQLLHNDRQGGFEDVTEKAGIREKATRCLPSLRTSTTTATPIYSWSMRITRL